MGERLKYGFYMALVKPLSWLPLWMLYGVSDVLRFVISNCMHYRRKVIRDNLSSCYPEKSRKELRQIEREFYKQFCDNIVETIKLLNISDRTMRRRLEVRDAALVEQAALKETSLYTLANRCGIAPAQEFVERFIEQDREVREGGR